MGKILRKAKARLKKARDKLAGSRAVRLASKALPVLGVAMGPLGRTAGVRLGAALGGAQRIAKVSKGDFSQEISQVRQLGSVLGGQAGKLLGAGAEALAIKKGEAVKSTGKKKNSEPSKAAVKKAAQAAIAGKGSVVVQAKSGRKYRVTRVG